MSVQSIQAQLNSLTPQLVDNPSLQPQVNRLIVDLRAAEREEAAASNLSTAGARREVQSGQQEMVVNANTNPGAVAAQTPVATTTVTPGQLIDAATGQTKATTPVTAATVGSAATADDPKRKDTNTAGTKLVSSDAERLLNGLKPTQGNVSKNAQVTGQTSQELSASELEAYQLGQAQVVSPAAERTIQSGELVSGSAVDMAEVEKALDIQAAQANPSAQATVQGQLTNLMADFDGTAPPAWAAGALRNASSQMAARGLGASSMAGQAIVQAAMESALPIAMQDASTFATFEGQNLSNRQQTAMFAAEQRASFLGMEFTQDFQARVANASRIADVANMNFTAEQQVALENARMAQTVDITNLTAKNAKMMSDAAAMSQMDMANLNNRQQAAVINAQSFLAVDMKNMDMAQQTSLFKSQQNIQALFTDQAAVNASAQFNATSKNQTDQFFANLQSSVSQFNSAQTNAIKQFNAGEENVMEKFNSTIESQRDQFNAQNSLVISQANAQWRQSVATSATAAQNISNLEYTKNTNAITGAALDQIWQRERDLMDFAFKSSESVQDRANAIMLAKLSGTNQKSALKLQADMQADQAKGAFLSNIVGGLLFG